MISPIEVHAVVQHALGLGEDSVSTFLPTGAESHRIFGAAFLILGSLLLVEILAGKVWFRSRWRTLIWPGALVFLGLGMTIVTLIDPKDKPIHFALAVFLLVGGILEGRYRLGLVPRMGVDLFVIGAALLGGILMGPVHARGELATVAGQRHPLIGITGIGLGIVRAAESARPRSLNLRALFAILFASIGLQFLMMGGHQH